MIRTCARAWLASVNWMFPNWLQAFMWLRMRALSAESVVSRNATPSFTPPLLHHLLVMTAMRSRCGGGSVSAPTAAITAIGGALAGLVSMAVLAAAICCSFGNCLTSQPM